jgi:hypothetical protein
LQTRRNSGDTGCSMTMREPKPRGRRPWLGAPLLLVLLLVVNGCEGCKGCGVSAGGFKFTPSLWMSDACTDDTDCKQTCPQGNECIYLGPDRGGPDHKTCHCRAMFGESCATAVDCKPFPECDRLFTCTHYPGSVRGTCECRADCETAADCKPIAGCPEGPVCQPFRWGDRGACSCASKVEDGGLR